MKVIVPANNKGGVGKTKISILLTEYFGRILKKKVLAIDFDPQCNFSQRFLNMEIDPYSPGGKMPPVHPDFDPTEQQDPDGIEERSSIADIFFGRQILPYPTHIENVDISPAHADKLLMAESVSRSDVVEKVHKHLGALLELPELKKLYEVIIVDTAPSKGPLTIAAIKAATHMLIPSIMEEAPIQGVYGMLQLWKQESVKREESFPLELIGVLPSMVRPTNLHKDMLKSLNANKTIAKYMMPVFLSLRTSFAEVDSEGAVPTSVFDLPDSSQAKQEALKVCEYIAEKVFAHD